jgi:hypothetical protein
MTVPTRPNERATGGAVSAVIKAEEDPINTPLPL